MFWRCFGVCGDGGAVIGWVYLLPGRGRLDLFYGSPDELVIRQRTNKQKGDVAIQKNYYAYLFSTNHQWNLYCSIFLQPLDCRR